MLPRPDGAELLDEHCGAGITAAGYKVADASEVERTGARSGFAAENAPGDAVQA